MAIRPLLYYPDERLRTVAQPVSVVDSSIRCLLDDLAETMYAAPGIGLAATQVNVHVRVLVVDISADRSSLLSLINPEIIEQRGSCEREEGCLSVPGIFERVTRAAWVRVRALDRSGNIFSFTAEGMLAACVQHEMDHLEGKVFVEYLSPLKRSRIKTKLLKRSKEAA
jgi:peptide deformylase